MSSLTANPLWFATRATGTIALILLTVTVMLGIVCAGRYAPRALHRFEMAALHRNVSVLTLVFLGVHIVTALADTYVTLRWVSAVLPFLSPYRPLWVGLGTVAFDLLLAVAVTSAVRLRLRLGAGRWKAVHWLAYPAWAIALFHMAGTGTDTRLAPQLLLLAVCVGAVVITTWWRLYAAGPGRVAQRMWLAVTAGTLPLVLVTFLVSGPLVPGWAHHGAGL